MHPPRPGSPPRACRMAAAEPKVATGAGLRAREWRSRSISRPMPPAWQPRGPLRFCGEGEIPVVVAASRLRSSGPYVRNRCGTAACCESRGDIGQMVRNPPEPQLAVRRDLPMGHEGSTPSKAKRPAVLRAGRSFAILRRGRDSNPANGVGNNLKGHATLRANAVKRNAKWVRTLLSAGRQEST